VKPTSNTLEAGAGPPEMGKRADRQTAPF